MGRSDRQMEMARLLLATVLLCALAHSTADVQEIHDDIGPVSLGDVATDPQAIVMLQREQLGEDSELALLSDKRADKQLTWNCDMAKKCKCAGKMMSRGVELESMRLLDTFSAEDELVFLQAAVSDKPDPKYDIAKQAAKFSGFKWESPRTENVDSGAASVDSSSGSVVVRVRNTDPHVVAKHITMMKDYLKGDPDKALTKDDTVQQVIDATKSLHPQKEVKELPQVQPKISTKGVGKILKEADDEESMAQEKNSIESQGSEQDKCLEFCSMLAKQSSERAEVLAGEKKKMQLQQKEERLKDEEKRDKEAIEEKKKELKDEEQQVQRAKVKDLGEKEAIDKQKKQKAEEKASAEKAMEKTVSNALDRESKKLVQKLKDLQDAAGKEKKEREEAKNEAAKTRAANAAKLAKENAEGTKIEQSEETLQKDAADAMKKAFANAKKAEAKEDAKDKAKA